MRHCPQSTNNTKMQPPNGKQTICWCMWYSRTQIKLWRKNRALHCFYLIANWLRKNLVLVCPKPSKQWYHYSPKFGHCIFQISLPPTSGTLTPIHPQLLTLANFKNLDHFANVINQLIIDEDFNADKQPGRPKPDYKICSSQHLKHARILQPWRVWKERDTMSYKTTGTKQCRPPHQQWIPWPFFKNIQMEWIYTLGRQKATGRRLIGLIVGHFFLNTGLMLDIFASFRWN